MKLCLVASSGGHLMQLLRLREVWEPHERFWVSFEKKEAVHLLEGERIEWAFHPTNRNLVNFVRNFFLAWKLLKKEKPDAVISTGAGVAVPFLWVGRLLGIKTLFIESLTRVHDLSLTGKLVYPWADQFFVQWPPLASRYPKALYRGNLL